MTDEVTKDLTDSEKLNLILAELADLRTWRAKVDAFMEDRSRDTRPKLEMLHKEIADTRTEARERFDQVDVRLTAIEREVKTIRREIGLLREDIWGERKERAELAERVSALEQRPF